jgi:hypothetical protein
MLTYMTRGKYGASYGDLSDPILYQTMQHSMQIFDHLTGVKELENPNHPVLRMWEGYEFALGIYAMMGNLEWTFKRGYADHEVGMFFYKAIKEMQSDDVGFVYETPPWVGDPAVIRSHRSNLQRRTRAPSVWKDCPKDWPYIWPLVDDTEAGYRLWISKSDKSRILEGSRARPDSATLERIVNWP